FIAQQGLHLFGWIGHEGLHFNLVKNRRLSAFLGLSFSSMIVSHMGFGFALSHWNHHRFANQKEDPDRQIFEKFHTVLERLLFARLVADWHYLVNGILAAFGKLKIDTKGFPLSRKEQQLMAWLNIVLATGWVAVYAWLIAMNPIAGMAAIGLPHLLVVLLTGLRPYLEHAGTEPELFRTSRTRVSSLLSTVYFFNNYHLEHHLYPKVPCYNLPKVHQYLKAKGYFEMANSFVEKGSLANFKYVTASFQYASSPSETPRTLDAPVANFQRVLDTSRTTL
ncbi:MAG: fatty acid desaturase family protein, partial [Leptospirales bacterium]